MMKKIVIVFVLVLLTSICSYSQNYHEYDIWHKLLRYSISPDGNWAMWNVKYCKKSDSLYLKNITSKKEYKFKDVSNQQFSNDSKWIVFSVAGDKTPDSNIQYRIVLLNLSTGKEQRFKNIESSNFVDGGKHLLLIGETQNGNRELNFYNLKTGLIRTIYKTKNYSISRNGRHVAYCVKTSNGYNFEVLNIDTGEMAYMDNSAIEYENIAWRDHKLIYQNTADSVQRISIIDGVTTGKIKRTSIAAKEAKFPENKVINFANKLMWSSDNKMVFYTLSSNTKPVKNEGLGDVDIWHWKDERVQSRQQNRYYADIRKGDLCVWFPYEDRWKQLTDSTITAILSVSKDGKYVIATDDRNYRPHFREAHRDIYIISTTTSERTLLLENSILTPAFSPNSNYIYYFKDKTWFLYHLSSKKSIDISSSIGVDFSNKNYDGPIDIAPPYNICGWSDDDNYLWLYDEFDIWSIDTKKLSKKRITNGREQKITFRKTNIGTIGKKGTVLLKATGDDYKMGLYSMVDGSFPKKLFYERESILLLSKSNNNNSFLCALESNIESSELYYFNLKTNQREKLSNTNRNNDNFKFRKSEVVYYKNSKGKELRGALFYPMNYVNTRRYPMIVHIYERLSGKVNDFVFPSPEEAYNSTNYILNGYFVFQPDIAYEVNNPGLSASDCVVSAVNEVLKNYNVDSSAIGLIGHSWGAYQTAFIISQTNIFKAAVAGAPLTNMISMYNSRYKESGRLNQEMFETSQGRFRLPWWKIRDNFIENSPIFQVSKINTPLLMIFGEDDNSVDWSQGCEMYVTMRRQGKPCILLSYKDEGHSIGSPANQLDQSKRILDYFDYYLKGGTARKWIEKGRSYIEKMKGE